MEKLTIIKVADADFQPTQEDLDRWNNMLNDGVNGLAAEKGVSVEEINDITEKTTLVVRIGDENYQPTTEDLEGFMSVFQEAENQDHFKIICSCPISVEKLEFGKIITVE